MKNLKFGLLFCVSLVCGLVTAQDFEGTWNLKPVAGAMGVGPVQGDIGWWSNSIGDVTTRACLFDDDFVFNSDASFQNVQGTDTWLETWQGAPEGCGTPVSPHDGSNAATYSYDSGAGTLTLTGVGAHLGLAKVYNGGELSDPANAPASITYMVSSVSATEAVIDIDVSGAWWRFVLAKQGGPVSGCTDSTAQNYNSAAVTDDGSCSYLLTLTVDMTDVTGFTQPTVNGTFNGWCGNCNPLSDNGDGTWSTVLTVAGDIEYKFAADDWAMQEGFSGGESCTVTNGGFTNRFVSVSSDTTIGEVCWNACVDCATAAASGCTDSTANNYDSTAVGDDGSCLYDVTLTVDMSQQPTAGPVNTVFGTFNAWCAGCTALNDNMDGTWSATIELGIGDHEYKFHNDGVGALGAEPLPADSDCTNAFTNRVVSVSGVTVVPTVCWNSCEACPAMVAGCTDSTAQNYNSAAVTEDGSCQYLLTVSVDMSQVTDAFTQPTVNGTFNGWCGNCNPLSDNGDGTWSTTLTVVNGGIEYKFAADDWAIQEGFAGGESCTITTDGFTNRFIDVTGDTTVDLVCYNSCDACPAGEGCTDSAAQNYDSTATTDNGSCQYLLTLSVDLSNQVAGPVTTVFGGFNGWCAGCNLMTDNGDGTFTTTVTVDSGDHEYKFFNDGAGGIGEETLTPGDACTITTGSFTNRLVNVTGDTTVDLVCWNSCDVCETGGDLEGCTDSTAQNYSSMANVDNGSCQYLLTLSVDMSEVTDAFTQPTVNGAFNGWCGNCNPLSDNGDGTWSTTLTVTNGDQQYKFAADDWALEETLTATNGSCTIVDGAFTNRIVNVAGDTTVSLVCWDKCVDCATANASGCTDPAAQNYDSAAGSDDGSCQYLLTLTVDMTDVTDPFTQPTVNGTFNGWCGNCNPLSDNGDGTWSTTLTVQNGDIEYKFAADDWSIQEEFVGGESCTLTTGAFTNRLVSVAGDTTIDAVCWESCVACAIAAGCTDAAAQNYDSTATVDDGTCQYLLTVTVNMSEVTAAFTQPTVNGTFNGWCGNCNPLSDNGDGTWSTTLTVQNGDVEYKFAADDWAIQENFLGGESCTLTTDGFTNRLVNITGDTTVDVVCWESCDDCGAGCTDPLYLEFDPYASVDDGSCATLVVEGCVYADAENYDSSANVDDGSCMFDLGSCPGDFNDDDVITAADLTGFLSVFGGNCP